jgi:hypothetical protein
MTAKKITPKNPEASTKRAEAGSKDESKATARKTQTGHWARKMARKTASGHWA